ncbi:MAG TPA: histidine phosphatase family protein [Dongiaceae bacterium]|jgi:phosphohistidine phosphatase
MKRLLLLRHAKSSRDNPRLADFDRPLAKRGREAAPEVGQFLSKSKLVPDLVLCSTARRTQETADLALASFRRDITVRLMDPLYLAPPEQILKSIRGVEAKVKTLMVIGHNPGMAQLANHLADGGDKTALQHLRQKFPTAALAVFEADVDSWSKFERGTLLQFVTPKDLDND